MQNMRLEFVAGSRFSVTDWSNLSPCLLRRSVPTNKVAENIEETLRQRLVFAKDEHPCTTIEEIHRLWSERV